MTDKQCVDITHVSSAHPWTDNRIHYREAMSLAAAGYRVSLIAVESPLPGEQTEVDVRRIPQRARLARMTLSSAQATIMALRTRAKVLHLHDPELIPHIPIMRLLGRTVIYDAHEDLPAQVAEKAYLPPLLRKAAQLLAHVLVALSKSSDHVVCATEKIAERYDPERSTVVHNYPPLRQDEEDDTRVSVQDREAQAVYVGAMSEGRGARVMIAAFDDISLPTDWVLSLAGTAPTGLLGELASDPGWERVEFHGHVAPKAARDLILGARVGLVLFAESPAHLEALPTKMFEYFAAGVPVIASDFPLWREIIETNGCGLLVDQRSPRAVAQAIRKYAEVPSLLEEHSRNARRFAVTRGNWAQEASRLLAAYASLESI